MLSATEIRALRLAAGWTQIEAARAAGVSRANYQRMERARNPVPMPPDALALLVPALEAAITNRQALIARATALLHLSHAS